MNPDTASLPLRDIHLPDAVPWWPPAIGWWILLGLLIAIAAIVFFVRYIKKRKQFSRLALAELNRVVSQFEIDGDSQKLLKELSAILRRVSITAFPDKNPAGITGEDWLKFLDEVFLQLSNKQASSLFCGPLGQPLIIGPYKKQASISEQDARQLIVLCGEWIRLVARRMHRSDLASGAYA